MPNLTALDGLFENLFQLADQSRIQLEYLQNDFFDLVYLSLVLGVFLAGN
jgi:hypothetical protein